MRGPIVWIARPSHLLPGYFGLAFKCTYIHIHVMVIKGTGVEQFVLWCKEHNVIKFTCSVPLHAAVPIGVIQGNTELGYETIRPGGDGSAFGLLPTGENVKQQALPGPLSLEAGYERMYSSTRARTPPAVYNQLQTLTSDTPAEYSIPQGVSSPPGYGKLSVEAQYTVSDRP